MTCAGDDDDPFPVDDRLFADTFSEESAFTLLGEQLKVRQVFGAKLGVAARVWEALQDNVSANMPSGGWPTTLPTVLPLSWGEGHMSFPSDWDLVLCADTVYLPATYPLLVETLAHLCKNRAVVYLSSKMWKEHETPGFYEECLPSRFNVELVHRDDNQNINIHRASLRKDQ